MPGPYTYTAVSPTWNQFASKGDTIQIQSQNQTFKGQVESVNKDGVVVALPNTPTRVDVKHSNYKIVERKYANINNIPIEVGDLITYIADGNNYTAVIVGVEGTTVIVDVVSNPKLGRQQTLVNKVSFVTKGFSISMPTVSNGQVQDGQGSNSTTVNNVPGINTAQNASQIALLYPAPCVVMAVPYNTNPDSFPEAMYVQMPDRSQPVLLPVVRMGCDTALVVIPPSKNKGQATISMTPVKATSARASGPSGLNNSNGPSGPSGLNNSNGPNGPNGM